MESLGVQILEREPTGDWPLLGLASTQPVKNTLRGDRRKFTPDLLKLLVASEDEIA